MQYLGLANDGQYYVCPMEIDIMMCLVLGWFSQDQNQFYAQ